MAVPSPPEADRVDAHQVVFHAEGSHLATIVADRVDAQVSSDSGIAVLIATADHLRAISDELRRRGVDPDDARIVRFDADRTLERLLDDAGRLDPARYHEVVRAVIARHAAQGAVLVFGELVALLWERGEHAQALALERLWGETTDAIAFTLVCGYPIGLFDRDARALRSVCATHDATITHTGPVHLPPGDDPWPTLAELQRDATLSAGQLVALDEERERLHSQLAATRAEVEQLRRSASQHDRSVAMIAHDIRTPTTVLRALLELLSTSRTAIDEERIDRYLAAGTRNVAQIQRLVDDLGLLSRVRAGQLPLDLVALDPRVLVEQEIASSSQLTGRTIELVADDNVPPVLADMGRQRQILTNLLSNALRYSDADTLVAVHLEVREDAVAIHVRDHGRGIAETEREHLFEPYAQLSADVHTRGGSGLGLAITKALVEAQGGTIAVVSEPGVGSTFTFTVPRADRPDA